MLNSNRYVSVPFKDNQGKGFIHFNVVSKSKTQELIKIKSALAMLITTNPSVRFGHVKCNAKPTEGVKYDKITHRHVVKGTIHYHYELPVQEVTLA